MVRRDLQDENELISLRELDEEASGLTRQTVRIVRSRALWLIGLTAPTNNPEKMASLCVSLFFQIKGDSFCESVTEWVELLIRSSFVFSTHRLFEGYQFLSDKVRGGQASLTTGSVGVRALSRIGE